MQSGNRGSHHFFAPFPLRRKNDIGHHLMLALHGAARRQLLNFHSLPVGIVRSAFGEFRFPGRELSDDLVGSHILTVGSECDKATQQNQSRQAPTHNSSSYQDAPPDGAVTLSIPAK